MDRRYQLRLRHALLIVLLVAVACAAWRVLQSKDSGPYWNALDRAMGWVEHDEDAFGPRTRRHPFGAETSKCALKFSINRFHANWADEGSEGGYVDHRVSISASGEINEREISRTSYTGTKQRHMSSDDLTTIRDLVARLPPSGPRPSFGRTTVALGFVEKGAWTTRLCEMSALSSDAVRLIGLLKMSEPDDQFGATK